MNYLLDNCIKSSNGIGYTDYYNICLKLGGENFISRLNWDWVKWLVFLLLISTITLLIIQIILWWRKNE